MKILIFLAVLAIVMIAVLFFGSRIKLAGQKLAAFLWTAMFGLPGTAVGGMRTADVAFLGRMGAGFPGEVSRAHPFDITPEPIAPLTPPTAYGQPVLVDGNGQMRPFGAADHSAGLVRAWGFTVRPYPTQQRSGGDSSAFGAATPPVVGIIDVIKGGFVLGQLNPGLVAVKGGQVYVRDAVTGGGAVQGQLEVAASGNNTPLSECFFNGPADASGIVEVSVNNF